MLALPPTTFAPIGGGATTAVSMATPTTTTASTATIPTIAAMATDGAALSAPMAAPPASSASTALAATSDVSIGSTYVVTKDDMSVEPRPGLGNGPSATDIKEFAAQDTNATASSFRQAL